MIEAIWLLTLLSMPVPSGAHGLLSAAANSTSGAPGVACHQLVDGFMAPGLYGAEVSAGWPGVIVVVALGVILTIAFVATRRSRRQPKPAGADAPPDRDQQTAIWESTLRKACSADDPVAAGRALMGWARAKWPSGGPLTPGAVASKLESLALAAAVAELDRALYAPGCHPGSPAPWKGEPLWRAFGAARGDGSRRRELGPVLPARDPAVSSAGSDRRSATT